MRQVASVKISLFVIAVAGIIGTIPKLSQWIDSPQIKNNARVVVREVNSDKEYLKLVARTALGYPSEPDRILSVAVKKRKGDAKIISLHIKTADNDFSSRYAREAVLRDTRRLLDALSKERNIQEVRIVSYIKGNSNELKRAADISISAKNLYSTDWIHLKTSYIPQLSEVAWFGASIQ